MRSRANSVNEFRVKHYAGMVVYDVCGFSSKNNEQSVGKALLDLIRTSSSQELQEIFAEQIIAFDAAQSGDARAGSSNNEGLRTSGKGARRRRSGGSNGNKMTGDSVGKQFRASLKLLVEAIDGTHTNYVRCIKPNHDKASHHFVATEILRQLRYSGMMETIRIRQQGFGLRLLHATFLQRYGVLQPAAATIPELVGALSSILDVDDRDWQIGTSKVLMRQALARQLEQLITVRLKVSARIIRRAWLLQRSHHRASRIQATWRTCSAQWLWRRTISAILLLKLLFEESSA